MSSSRCAPGCILEEAEGRCGSPAALLNAMARGDVVKKEHRGRTLYFFPLVTLGTTDSMKEAQAMSRDRSSSDTSFRAFADLVSNSNFQTAGSAAAPSLEDHGFCGSAIARDHALGAAVKLETLTDRRLIKEHQEFQKLYRAAERILNDIKTKVQTSACDIKSGQEAIGLNITTTREAKYIWGPRRNKKMLLRSSA